MQVILGSNGVIGNGLAKELRERDHQIRLVSRNPKKYDDTDGLFAADLLNFDQTLKALEGAQVAYLTAGLPYNRSVWKVQWPEIMRNVINACITHQTKLVFFDNVYSYGPVSGWMTEDTPMHPTSQKGKIRAKIADMLLDEIHQGKLQALIARSADFYGPDTPLGIPNILVFEKLKKGLKAQWLVNDQVRHSYTYTPDASRATAILGNTDHAYGQIWHLPTDPEVLTGKQFIELTARECGVRDRHQVLPKWMIGLAGLFNQELSEIHEMLYQNDSDYLFDSSKFARAFAFNTTSYALGITETVRSMDRPPTSQ